MKGPTEDYGWSPACEICGDHIGAGFDHSECAKIKREAYGDSNENKKPKKKLSKKACHSAGLYFSRKFD